MRKICISWMTLCLLLLTGCGYSGVIWPCPIPTLYTDYGDDPVEMQYVPEQVKANIVMDTTDSMAGYARNPALPTGEKTVFTRAVTQLVDYTVRNSMQYSPRFFRTDTPGAPTQVSREVWTTDFTSAGFYYPMTWYPVRNHEKWDEIRSADDPIAAAYGSNIADCIENADVSRVTILITDLFENNDNNAQLVAALQHRFMTDSHTVAILPIRSEYDGYVFDVFDEGKASNSFYYGVTDENTNNFTAPSVRDRQQWVKFAKTQGDAIHEMPYREQAAEYANSTPKIRPFYMIFMGPTHAVRQLATDFYSQLRRNQGEKEMGNLLVFDARGEAKIIAVGKAGAKLEPVLEASKLQRLEQVTYYLPVNTGDAELQDDSAHVRIVVPEKEAPNMTSSMYRLAHDAEAEDIVSLTMPLTAEASANPVDNGVLDALYESCKVRVEARLYSFDTKDPDSGKPLSVWIDDKNGVRELKTNQRFPAYQQVLLAEGKDIPDGLLTIEPGSDAFIRSAENSLIANSSLSVKLDFGALPDYPRDIRIELSFYVEIGAKTREEYAVEGELAKYPWATQWDLDLNSLSPAAFRDPSNRELNGTVRLTDLVTQLLRAFKASLPMEVQAPIMHPINRYVFDLRMIK